MIEWVLPLIEITECQFTAIVTLLERSSGNKLVIFSYEKSKYLQYTTS